MPIGSNAFICDVEKLMEVKKVYFCKKQTFFIAPITLITPIIPIIPIILIILIILMCYRFYKERVAIGVVIL